MQDEDKIFGLIAQAEDIQKHAVALQRSAQDAIKTLPDASRAAVRDAAREFITEGAEKASRGILEASREALAASAELRGTQMTTLLKHILCLVLVAVVIVTALYFGSGQLIRSRLAEAQRLSSQVAALEASAMDFAQRAGKAVLATCGERLCVRVDERAGRFGETQNGELYMVLFNY